MGVNNMLTKFTADNYKNFQKPITIDFSATHDYKFNSKCVKNGLLSKLVIYGPNSSGKSNLGFALFDIVGLLTDKTTDIHQTDEGSFINADSDKKEASFIYEFKKGEESIVYEYKKLSPKKITYEALYINGKKVFSYDFEKRIKDFVNMALISADQLKSSL